MAMTFRRTTFKRHCERGTTRTLTARTLCAMLISTQGCFLPIPYTESGSPPLTGIIQRRDGTPAADLRIAVSTKYDDSTCTSARASAMTDSAGRFALPRTFIRRRGILLFPAFESFSNSYTLCGGSGTDTTLRAIYEGWVPLSPDAPSQALACFEWTWENRDRVTCSTRDESKVVEGGRWVDDGKSGWYRFIVTEELGRAPGYRIPVPVPRVYVLWIEESGSHPPLRVREKVQLPIDAKVTAVSHVELLERNGRWYANLPGYKKTFLNDFASAQLRFELGPPGRFTKVAGP